MDQPTRFNIPLSILLEAKKCNKAHACLTDEAYHLCGIRITAEHHARMVCGKKTSCPYSTRLGDRVVCSCPVRHAIYRKYGV